MRRRVRFALIGAGFIGRIHGLALRAVNGIGDADLPEAEATVLVDVDTARAERQAALLGFKAWSTDWASAIEDVDAVIVATPSNRHRELALAVVRGGKHLLCEKPVGLSAADAEAVAVAAKAAGVTNGVGFTYLRAPMIRHAIDIVRSERIGAPVSFRGWHAEDYLADGDAPFAWRLDASQGGRCGALGDLGWHIIAIARTLCGPIQSLSGSTHTPYPTRPTFPSSAERRRVENEDWAAALVRFRSGAAGTIEASRIAHGRKMDIGFELVCTRGSITFRGERANELELYAAGEPVGEAGFRRLLINGGHPGYAAFLPAAGHGLGFNDLKTIELHEFLRAIAAGRNLDPDLGEAVRIARVCEAILASAETGRRVEEPEEEMLATAAIHRELEGRAVAI